MLRNSITIAALLWAVAGWTQDFMMQAWYWDYPKPGCNGYSGNSWASTLAGQAGSLSNFTYLWLPPLPRASFGNCSNGYDPKDLYDLGEYGLGATGFGTRAEYDALISTLNGNGIKPIADVVYNHRDGGQAEPNPALKAYVEVHMNTNKRAFPSDRYRCSVPLNGTPGANGMNSALGAGAYYFRISSKTGAYGSSYRYKVYITTEAYENQPYQGAVNEVEDNGGKDCNQSNNTILLNQDMQAYLGTVNNCNTDEFQLSLSPGQFNASGDRLIIYLTNIEGGYSDHRIYAIYYDPDGPGTGVDSFLIDMDNLLLYETYTLFDFSHNQGEMNFEYFKPNTTNTSYTQLDGDWDWLWFFYDYDQAQPQVGAALSDWTNWLWEDAGIRGYRMDAVKHFPPGFIGTAMSGLLANSHSPGIVVGEYFDSNPFILKNWVDQANTGAPGVGVRAFDFALRDALKQACENNNYDSRDVFTSGMVDQAGSSGFDVVTFLNNHDFRTNGEYLKSELLLAYAYILTNNKVGAPCVFYPDYMGVGLGYYQPPVLKPQIDQLINLHKTYIFGAPTVDYLNRKGNPAPYAANYFNGCQDKALIYQISGGPTGQEVIVAINFCDGPLKVDHVINTANAPSGTRFDDVIGNSNFPFAIVSDQNHSLPNSIYIELPPNSYSVWVQSGGSLPLELLGFSARVENGTAVLNWQSANEEQFKGFEIERSSDGKNFQPAGWIPAQGRAGTSFYAFTDANVAMGRTYYYRLRMEDEDGSFIYSPLRHLYLPVEKASALLALPNPTAHMVMFRWTAIKTEAGQLRAYNAQGLNVLAQQVPFRAGSNQVEVDASSWPRGTYFIELITESGFRWHTRVLRL